MEKINLQRLRPNPTILKVDSTNDDHEVLLTFYASSDEGSGKGMLILLVDATDSNIFVISEGNPSKTLLIEIDITANLIKYEQKVTLRVLAPRAEAKPFGIAILKQNSAPSTVGINYISYVMVYEKST